MSVTTERYSKDRVSRQFPRERYKTHKGAIFNSGGPKWTDIRQRGIGNCFFLSSLKSICLRNPGVMRRIIRDNGDGSVTVRLFVPIQTEGYGVTHYDEVNYVIDKSKNLSKEYNHHKALWVDLLEQAYALHRVRLEEARHAKSDYKTVLKGGTANAVYQHLLGINGRSTSITYQAYKLLDPVRLDPVNQGLFDDYIQINNPGLVVMAGKLVQGFMLNNNSDRVGSIREFFNDDEASADFMNNFPCDLYGVYHQCISNYLKNGNMTDDAFKQELSNVLVGRLKHNTMRKIAEAVIRAKQDEQDRYESHQKGIYQDLLQSLQTGELVCAGTIKSDNMLKGLCSGHEYHVINVYQRQNGRYYVQLDNPWGYETPTYDPNTGELLTNGKSILRHQLVGGNRINPAIQYGNDRQAEIDNNEGIFELELSVFIENYGSINRSDMKSSQQSAIRDTEMATQDRQEKETRLADARNNGEKQGEAVLAAHNDVHEAAVKIEDNLQATFMHVAGTHAQLAPENVSEGDSEAVGRVEAKLKSYLNNFDKDAYKKKSIASRYSHRLFKTGPNRYISTERRQRADIALALIETYKQCDDDRDKGIIISLLKRIQQQHKKDNTFFSGFHGDRLGAALKEFESMGTNNQLAQGKLSAKASQLLGRALIKSGVKQFKDSSMADRMRRNSSVYVRNIYEQIATEKLLTGKAFIEQYQKEGGDMNNLKESLLDTGEYTSFNLSPNNF